MLYVQGGPKKVYIFQHTVPLEPFKKNETDFTKMFLEFLGTEISMFFSFCVAVKYSLQISFSFIVPKRLLPTVQLMIFLL